MNGKPMKKAIHRWELVPSSMGIHLAGGATKESHIQMHLHGFRSYVCKRCGAGPVRIREESHKSSINKNALKQGISSDCNYEMVRGILES
jgi:hypothetical protein